MTTSDTGKVATQQLAGPGVDGLDQDPPLFHFDIDSDQIEDLLNDPQGFLTRIGLGPDQGIAPNGRVNVITNFNQQWTGRAWRKRDVGAEARPRRAPKGCCYVSDDSVICHVH